MKSTILFVPGLRDHVADHWQTLLAAASPGSRTVPPLADAKLSCAARVAALGAALAAIEGPVVLAAHSAGVLMVAHWARRHSRPIRGALLATHDELQSNGWLPVPRQPLPFRSIVAYSDNDPLAQPAQVAKLAHDWRSELVALGDVGHLNPASGFGPWPQAMALLEALDGADT